MTDLPSLPAWAKTLQRRIRQRGIDFFILHGPGVRDLHPLGARRFGTSGDCLAQVILNDRSAIVTYDRGAGIGFSDRDVENDFKTVLKAYDKLGGTNLAQVQPRDPDRALQLIETYLRYQLSGNPRFSAAVIIDCGETVAPAGGPGQRSSATAASSCRRTSPPYRRKRSAPESRSCGRRSESPRDSLTLTRISPRVVARRFVHRRQRLGVAGVHGACGSGGILVRRNGGPR